MTSLEEQKRQAQLCTALTRPNRRSNKWKYENQDKNWRNSV